MAAQRKPSRAGRKFERAGSTRASSVADTEGSNRSGLAARLAARTGITTSGVVLLTLTAVTLAVYGQVWRFEFITLDDPVYVSTNPHVLSGLTVAGIKWAFNRFYIANWFPLTWLSLMIDGTAFEAWAGGYHLTNLLLHLANVLLVFVVFRKATGQEFLSAFVAALFAVHPVHAESVAWVSERKDVLSVFFGLLTLWAYVNYAQRGRLSSFLLALTFYALSLMSKQTLVTLPFVMLLLDSWPLKRLNRRALLEKIPFLVLSAVFCVVAVLAQASGLSVRSLEAAPPAIRLANAAIAYVSYLQKAIVPWNLGVYYPFSTDLSLPLVAFSLALLVALSALAVEFRRRYPFFAIGWFWYLGTLVPMIGLVQVGLQQMADRYAYFPFLGLYLALGGFVTSRRATVAVVGVYGILGFVQTGYWHDTLTLLDHTASVTRDNSFVRLALGDGLLADGRLDEALEQYRKAVTLAPADPGMHCKWAEVLFRYDTPESARREYEIALALNDKTGEAHRGLGLYFLGRKDLAGAKRQFQLALAADPGDQENHLNLARLDRTLGDFQGSIDHCRGALAINDNLLEAHRLLAQNLESLGRWDEAADRLRDILSIEPRDNEARQKLEAAIRMSKHR
ncbi:MAG TPA: tetratricopeptide repeat protein [Planctomycetaceae bacterium]|nr:tetratricopeptide repeat protein [Planctomycetaceae bacterium]